jgi:hypothetical protein
MEAARTSTSAAPDRHRYRCSLPGLTGFTANRRADADAGYQRLTPIAQGSGGILAVSDGGVISRGGYQKR